MFSPGFCKDVAKMPDSGCGAHNRGHFGWDSCSCKKEKRIQSILVHLDFIQIKATSIKKEKVSRKKPILRKDLNLQIKKNVSYAVKRVTGITNAQIKIKILDLLPCFQKTWIQPGGI